MLVANYTGGSVAVFPILADGKLGEASAFVQHTGKGTIPDRQEGPHAHSIDLSPDERFAMVDDLGLDELLVYKFDSAKGSLTPNDPPFTKLAAGAGPRHFVLRPDGKFAYVVTEIAHTVTVFSNDAANGKLTVLQTITTLPKDFSGRNDDAEIEVHPSGKFLYASNRGDDSIAIYAIDQSKGTLTQVGIVPTGGKEPRSFEIDPHRDAPVRGESEVRQHRGLSRSTRKRGQLLTPVWEGDRRSVAGVPEVFENRLAGRAGKWPAPRFVSAWWLLKHSRDT